jgi:hypothetical protein
MKGKVSKHIYNICPTVLHAMSNMKQISSSNSVRLVPRVGSAVILCSFLIAPDYTVCCRGSRSSSCHFNHKRLSSSRWEGLDVPSGNDTLWRCLRYNPTASLQLLTASALITFIQVVFILLLLVFSLSFCGFLLCRMSPSLPCSHGPYVKLL